MDKRLSDYMNSQTSEPLVLNEEKIIKELARRRKRMSVILLSLAGLLWTLLLYAFSFHIGIENQTIGIGLLCTISVSYICAGLFAGIVLKFRKVVL